MAKQYVGDTYTDENLQALEEKIKNVQGQMSQFNTTAATDDELRKRAESEYTPIYNAQVAEQQAAKNSAQSTLEGSLSALERQYSRDSEELGRAYDQQLASANNQMLARGFNNSSLAAAMANYVNTQRNRAIDNLAAERTAAENSARATYNNAITAADANIARLGSDLATNIDARLQALKDTEQSRVYQQMQAQNALKQYEIELALQLEQLRRQGLSDYISIHGTGGSSGGSSSSASKTGSTTGAAGTAATPTSSLGDKFNQSNKGSSAVGSAVKSAVSSVSGGISNALSGLSDLMSKVNSASKTSGKRLLPLNGANYLKD